MQNGGVNCNGLIISILVAVKVNENWDQTCDINENNLKRPQIQ
jgi:hypothetical protein